jgi:hypothetical protein
VAIALSAVFSRLLSRDLMSPGWAVIGVIGLAAGASWWSSWRPERRIDPAAAVAVLGACGLAAWAAWVPASLVLPESELLATIGGRASDAEVDAMRTWSEVGPGSCVPAEGVDLGIVGSVGSWAEVCVSGRSADEAQVTYRPLDPTRLTLTYGGPGAPGSCARPIGGRWWAVVTSDPADAMAPCPVGFAYHGV